MGLPGKRSPDEGLLCHKANTKLESVVFGLAFTYPVDFPDLRVYLSKAQWSIGSFLLEQKGLSIPDNDSPGNL